MNKVNYWELFLDRIKLLCRRKKILFFSLILPLLIMGIINFMMTALLSAREEGNIELGIVRDEKEMAAYSFLNKGEFHIVYGDKEKMQTLLLEKKIDAYLVYSQVPELHMSDMGRKQAIIKGYIDSEIQRMDSQNSNSKLIVNMTEPIALPDKKCLAFLYITSLLCILGARWGFEEMKELIPNQSAVSKRLLLSPVPKEKLLLFHLACVYILQTGCILIFSFIMLKTIGKHLQLREELYLATVAAGSLGSILAGAFFGTLKRINQKVKDVLLNGVLIVMLLTAFFTPAASRYFISDKLPYLTFLNPPALITEMLYCIALQNGLFVFLKDSLLLFVYTLAAGICLYLRYKWRKE
ncbi:ABC transporter permease [Anaerocolumna xylanovorans]|uniref:ABC-2 family transporter protein n=1 Tax=Anaerocolumna xylanovorans DSM 12503 TaxID=1121345 RepID=A0A1M7YJ48_9FIRM|nr:ABC transporter permease [Anaerocolumna xylanovorans]SHO52622.1 ABC-2 family transporter protein [Anaerocolumna xylanovorans DSM 12503]